MLLYRRSSQDYGTGEILRREVGMAEEWIDDLALR
jgi:hypothetical protein